jgi:dTDP-4-dehydrorhamnose reductase
MKILVLGSNGMAGHVVSKYLKEQNYEVLTAARSNADYMFDATNKLSIDILLDTTEFDYVINCVGLLVQESNTRPDNAAKVNSWFPQYLSYKLQNSSTKLIHLSTDCVFDGKQGPYTEQSLHSETNYYGRSKSLGEVNNNKDITFRMSIIGPEIKNGVGLFNFIYNNPDTDIPGWENAWWNGITTLQLAKCIDNYMKNPCVTGIYHLVNNDISINKYELLCLINKIYNLNKNIIKTKGPKDINKILIDTRQEFQANIPDYDTQLIEMKKYV